MMIHSINRVLHRILTVLSIIIFTVLIFDVVLGVSSRYLFGGQIRWTEELATFLLVWLVFCGAAVAYRDKAHLGIDLLVNHLDPGARKIAQITSHLVVLVFVAAVMIYGGSMLTAERFDSGQMLSTLGFEKAWLYLSIPLNGVFMFCFGIEALVDSFQGKLESTEHEEALS